MCYTEGYNTTMTLYSELHRVLRPGGRLITISLHPEEEVIPFATSNPNCTFIASSCSLSSNRQINAFHSFCIFDKIHGLDAVGIQDSISRHPIKFVKSTDCDASLTGGEKDNGSVDPSLEFEDRLMHAFSRAFDNVFVEP